MASLAERGINPKVVNDQIGRLTFTTDIAQGIKHLVETGAPSACTTSPARDEPTTWADVARAVFLRIGQDPARITGVTTTDYFAKRDAARRSSTDQQPP